MQLRSIEQYPVAQSPAEPSVVKDSPSPPAGTAPAQIDCGNSSAIHALDDRQKEGTPQTKDQQQFDPAQTQDLKDSRQAKSER